MKDAEIKKLENILTKEEERLWHAWQERREREFSDCGSRGTSGAGCTESAIDGFNSDVRVIRLVADGVCLIFIVLVVVVLVLVLVVKVSSSAPT